MRKGNDESERASTRRRENASGTQEKETGLRKHKKERRKDRKSRGSRMHEFDDTEFKEPNIR